jgi:hypothetical protein
MLPAAQAQPVADLKLAPDSNTKPAAQPFAKELAVLSEKALSIVVVGASGHLARTKTYPAMYLSCISIDPAFL